MAVITLLDIAKLNGNDAVVGLIEENQTYAPELSVFPARTIKGTQYQTGIRTGLSLGHYTPRQARNAGYTGNGHDQDEMGFDDEGHHGEFMYR